MPKPLTNEQIIATKRKVLGEQDRRHLMAVMLVNEALYQAAEEMLSPDSFAADDAHYALFWEFLSQLHKETGTLPPKEMLLGQIEASKQVGSPISERELGRLHEFLEYAESTETELRRRGKSLSDANYVLWGTKRLQWLLEEAESRKIRAQLSTEDNALTVAMPELLTAAVERLERICNVDAAVETKAFPPGWTEVGGYEPEPTRLKFFDDFLGGGTVNGEVYGLLGPYGTCKSTLARMLAVECARGYAQAHQEGSPQRMAFLISYEAPLRELRILTMAYAAGIPRDTFVNAKEFAKALSHSDSLRDYEKREYAHRLAQNLPVMGEYERLMAAKDMLNPHLYFLDFSGGVTNEGGTGGVDEIARKIKAVLRARGAACGGVIVDYVGAAVDRYMTTHNIPMSEVRLHVGGFPLRMKQKVAGPLASPVWVLHQLAAEVNARPSGAQQQPTDAAEARNFPENLDFCFQIGTPEDLNPGRIVTLSCGKHRRQPAKDRVFLRVDGARSRVLEDSANYYVEGNRIVPRHLPTTPI